MGHGATGEERDDRNQKVKAEVSKWDNPANVSKAEVF